MSYSMEDDKGLELSLGLKCGGSASKEKSGNSAETVTHTDERTSKILNDFRNFLNAGAQYTSQRSDHVKPPENFFNKIQVTASGETDSVIGSGVGENKRKNSFGDINNLKKQETESRSSDLLEKDKMSHISITTDEGSTADNEDVAESEVEGSTSRLASRHGDGLRTPGGSASSTQGPREIHGKGMIDTSTPPVQTVQKGPDKVNPWGLVSRVQPLQSPYVGRSIPASVSMQVNKPNLLEATRLGGHPVEQLQGSAAQSEDSAIGQPSSFPSEYPAIRPGIAAEVNFGGSGSFPNLPWVSTTGPGPNGKTISGVTYKFNATQIKIVCACHGTHMSPEQFVQHATEAQPSANTTSSLASLHTNNPGTPAKS